MFGSVIANFVLKFRNFRHHGNKDQYEANFNHVVKFADTTNPVRCEKLDRFPIQAEYL